jgi:hypothetical protein
VQIVCRIDTTQAARNHPLFMQFALHREARQSAEHSGMQLARITGEYEAGTA